MPKKVEKPRPPIELHTDATLKTLWVDNFQVAVREDEAVLIRLCSMLPEGLVEQARVMSGKSQLKELAKLICNTLDYFPEKEINKTVN